MAQGRICSPWKPVVLQDCMPYARPAHHSPHPPLTRGNSFSVRATNTAVLTIVEVWTPAPPTTHTGNSSSVRATNMAVLTIAEAWLRPPHPPLTPALLGIANDSESAILQLRVPPYELPVRMVGGVSGVRVVGLTRRTQLEPGLRKSCTTPRA